ncbi:MAG: hypothetical protein ACLGI6_11070 [Gammaproteobacteria bacterium]
MMGAAGWRWRAEVLAVRHGLWIVPGIALLASALAAWLVWVPQRAEALKQAEAALAQAQRTPPPAVGAQAAPAALPPAAMAQESVQRLLALARQQGLQVRQVEYRRQESGRAGRWQVQMPATGTYPQVRYFVRSALTVPGASLDEIGVHRAQNGNVEARMLFSVWYSARAGEGR